MLAYYRDPEATPATVPEEGWGANRRSRALSFRWRHCDCRAAKKMIIRFQTFIKGSPKSGRSWRKAVLRKWWIWNVRSRRQSGKHFLALSFSGFDPYATLAGEFLHAIKNAAE
jgi:hypothetical protein